MIHENSCLSSGIYFRFLQLYFLVFSIEEGTVLFVSLLINLTKGLVSSNLMLRHVFPNAGQFLLEFNVVHVRIPLLNGFSIVSHEACI